MGATIQDGGKRERSDDDVCTHYSYVYSKIYDIIYFLESFTIFYYMIMTT